MKTSPKIVLLTLFMLCLCGSTNAQLLNWKFTTGDRIYGKPLISNQIVYIGSLDSNFYAINAATGTKLWQYKTPDRIFTTAVLYDTILCFASGNHLIGLNINGELLWDFVMLADKPVNEHDNWDNFNSSPLLEDSIAYVGCDKGHVYGVNVKTGKQMFHCQTPTKTYTIETTPVKSGNLLYFGDWDGVFYAYNIDTETKKWEYDTKKDNTYSWVNAIETEPVIYDGSIYFAGRSCNLYSLNDTSGEQNWKFHDPNNMWLLGGLTIDDTIIYLGSSNQFTVQSFGAKGGKALWTTKVDGRVYGIPYYDDNYVYVGTGKENTDKIGSLYILNKKDGTVYSRYKVFAQVYAGPVVDDSVIYFGSADKNVYALSLKELLKIPDTYLKDINQLELGEIETTQKVDTSFYIYNKGEGIDSLNLTREQAGITVAPIAFILEPNDSQKISVSINASSFSVKSYTKTISFSSYYSPIDQNFSKEIVFSVIEPEVGIKNRDQNTILGQNYPNPFSVRTIIPYSIERRTNNMVLSIYSITGEMLEVLESGEKSAGNYTAVFDARKYPNGIYYYILKTDDNQYAKKMIISR